MIIKDLDYRSNFRNIILNHLGSKETFAFHPDIENVAFSTHGKVKNMITGKILSQMNNGNGYSVVNVKFNSKGRRCAMVHRLIMESFHNYLGINNYYYEVNHIDGNKNNNNISNLEWLTREENLEHSRKNKLRRIFKGEDNGNSKLSFKDVQDMRELYKLGFGIQKIADSFNVNRMTASNIINMKKRINN